MWPRIWSQGSGVRLANSGVGVKMGVADQVPSLLREGRLSAVTRITGWHALQFVSRYTYRPHTRT